MVGCERCGRFDESLRATSFIYTISVVLMTFRRGAGGVYCGSCRKKAGLKYSLISAIFGWWGIPWGPIYTVQAIGRNSAGGYQDEELNAELLQAVASDLIDAGNKPGAIRALEQSLRLHDDATVRQVLWSLQGEAAASAARPLGSLASAEVAARAEPTLRPGQLVRTADGTVALYAVAGEGGEPVAHLGTEKAVVLRAQDDWVELQVPGGGSGWTKAGALVAE